MKKMKRMDTKKLVLASILTAIVVVLQFWASTIKLGPFSITTALVPIVIGAATCGIGVGAWLGLIFGLVVLWSGDAAPFWAVNIPGTIITVLAKGTLCGLASGIAYKYTLLFMDKFSAKRIKKLIDKGNLCQNCETSMLKYFSRNNKFVATITAAIICPIVNTGVFVVGCFVFFLDTIRVWAGGSGAVKYIFVGLVWFNFLIEIAVNIILTPVIVRLLNARKKQ